MILFTGIKLLRESKKFLYQEYIKNHNICLDEDKVYMNLKYDHSYDCLKILKSIAFKKYLKYSSSILLHDVGRFYEYKKIDNFKHAQYGYLILKKNYTKNPLILLPVKYHESDLNWLEELYLDKEYLNCNYYYRKEIIKCCQLVRDIDVISNMKSILNSSTNKQADDINYKLIKVFKNGDLARKEMIKNEYDQIIYILCGLSIITDKASYRYLKKKKIVKELIEKLFVLSPNNNKAKKVTIQIKDIVNEKYNI